MKDREKVFYITCDCGCGEEMILKNSFGSLYVSFAGGYWYHYQHTLRDNISDALKYFSGEKCLKEILVKRAEFTELHDFLKNVEITENIKDSENESYILFELADKNSINSEDDLFAICLMGRMKKADIIRGKYYRMFELKISKGRLKHMIKKIEKIM